MEYYLTPEKLGELKIELERLKTDARIEISEKIKRAKEYGDLSENAEYSEARDEQAELEKRIAEMEDLIGNAVLIKNGHNKKGLIEIGSTFTVSKNGKEAKMRLVGSNEADPITGLVSNESPLGKELLGKGKGDTVTIKAPMGEIKYKILQVE
ncbi:MAG: transcription elongation factor GreA [Candidatus Pacebacteria bacterium]|nr:transcription elongation factor GreA [Candidatus Paceibacterota bacterium]